MKICKNCGSENIDSGRFCIDCGQRFEFITPESPVTSSYDYAINAPATRPSPSSQFPSQRHPRQEYPITEEFSNIRTSNGLEIFSKASLLLALIPIALLVINLIVPEGSFDLILTLIGLIPLPIFTYGLYSFVNEMPMEFKDQGSTIVKLLAAYCILGSIFTLSSSFLSPIIPQDASISELQSVASTSLLIGLVGLIVEVIFLIGAMKFTDWFNEITMRIGSYNSTARFRWFGILNVISAGTIVLTFMILLTLFDGSGSEDTILLAAVFLLIGAIAALAGAIMQILAGYKIYKILKQVQYVQ
ncbi:MAG: zinc ribbon domain-containing protein [Candidatus Heimdallarchaeota archaeon]|nr:zinc ribbon domain-containing protein [Candidatus Heimdallarchaeota archaeon]